MKHQAMHAKCESMRCEMCGSIPIDPRSWDLLEPERNQQVFVMAPTIHWVYPDEFDVMTLGVRAARSFADLWAEALMQPWEYWLRRGR